MAVKQVNNSNFNEEVISSAVPVIIDFWASWCGPCQMMGPVFEELSGEYEGRLKFAKVSTEEEPALAARFQIQGIPCLVLVKDGREIDRITGFAPKEMLKSKIDSVLERIG